MTEDIACPHCGRSIEPDSVFCRHCGEKTPAVDAANASLAASLLERTGALLSDFKIWGSACDEFLTRFPIHEAADDVRLTMQFRWTIIAFLQLEHKWPDTVGVIGFGKDTLLETPPVLGNGVVVSGRIADAKKREAVAQFIRVFQDVTAIYLLSVHEQNCRDTQSLLVEGKNRAELEGITILDAYQDAELYYKAYQDGDLEAALKGFSHLQEINPSDAYFRTMLGSTLERLDKVPEAFREYLYGLYLSPDNAALAANVLRRLAAQALYPAAFEVLMHYRRVCGTAKQRDAQHHALMDEIGRLARLCTLGFACALARVQESDINPGTSDVLDEIAPRERPWLTFPKDPAPDVLEGKQVFISYRRSDSSAAERLHLRLRTAHPSLNVFRDVSAIVGGADFVETIKTNLQQADVVLALIGPSWQTTGAQKRLRATKDILRRELAWAIAQGKAILPVLVDDTPMPSSDDLPEVLHPILRLNAERFREAHEPGDVERILMMIRAFIEAGEEELESLRRDIDELDRLRESDPEAYEKKSNQMFLNIPVVITQGAMPGVGIPERLVQMYGIWEIRITDGYESDLLDLAVEYRPGSRFAGKWTTYAEDGEVIDTEDITGEWARVASSSDWKIVLGFQLRCLHAGEPITLMVPLHEKVGNSYFGVDPDGRRFVSRNIESRSGTF